MGIWRIKSLFSLSKHELHPNSLLFQQAQCRDYCSSRLQSRLENVGFIGLGNMGSRMAVNLIKSGFKVSVHDLNAGVTKNFVDNGVPVKESSAQIAEASDVVITMLPSSSHVIDVYMGANGLLAAGSSLRPWLFIDSSTIDPLVSRKLSVSVSDCSLREKIEAIGVVSSYQVSLDGKSRRVEGIEKLGDCKFLLLAADGHNGQENPFMLDAPVSGGILAAEAGTLTFMVGGAEEAYAAAEPLFHSMGRDSIYCGRPGNGSVAKICNNLAMAISMIGVSEALAVGQSLGIAATTLTRVLNSSSGRCWSSDSYNPVPGVMPGVPSSRNYEGGFASKLMAKDLDLAAASAKEAAAKHPLTALAQQIFHELCKEGHEAKDFSCLFRHYYGGKDESSS